MAIIKYLFYTYGFLYLLSYALELVTKLNFSSPTMLKDAHWNRSAIIRSKNTGLLIDGLSKSLSEDASMKHLLLAASSGSGKTTSFALPNIIKHADGKRSFVITDIKGEISPLVSGYLHTLGYEVKILDFINPSNSDTFNPLLALKKDIDFRAFLNSIEFISGASNNKQAHMWNDGAKDVLRPLLTALHNYAIEEKNNLSTLIKTLYLIRGKEDDIPYKLVNKYGDKESIIRFSSFYSDEYKIFQGKLATAKSFFSAFDIKEILSITQSNSIDFSSIRQQPTALILKMPQDTDGSSPYSQLASLFYSQLLEYLSKTPLRPEDLPVYCLLDEFGNTRIPNIQGYITTLRSQKVSLSLMIQALSQLKSQYSSAVAETIIANCHSLLAYPGIKEGDMLKLLEKLLGKKTNNRGFSVPLFSENEIRTLSSDMALLITGNENGVKLKQYPVFKNLQMMRKAGLYSEQDVLYSKFAPIIPRGVAPDIASSDSDNNQPEYSVPHA